MLSAITRTSILRPSLPFILARAPTLPWRRAYALSRFTERAIGTGRKTRRGVGQRPVVSQPPQVLYEEKPSIDESEVWSVSSRPPSSNPEEGLKRLLLGNEALVITRQLEMLNIFVGFEQSNKYVISNEDGEPLGYIAEEPRGFLSMFARQIFRTHRPFRAVILDFSGSPILWLRRPFAWINSRMYLQRLKDLNQYSEEGEPILDTFAEVQQIWHPWRRRYDLFLQDTPHRILSTPSEPQPEPAVDGEQSKFTQFARIDQGFLAWHFNLVDARKQEIASVDRAFRGFGREIFTDTGQYFVRFGPKPPKPEDTMPRTQTVIRNLTLDERALVLGMAVLIDFDYFSRHSHGGGIGFMHGWDIGE